MRTAAGGRNWEGFGADPYLSGEASYETIVGVQSVGVQGSAKHFINNDQEHFRESSSSNVDDRYVDIGFVDNQSLTWVFLTIVLSMRSTSHR